MSDEEVIYEANNESGRIYKGGTWLNAGWYFQASSRYSYVPDFQYEDLGFRCVRIDQKTEGVESVKALRACYEAAAQLIEQNSDVAGKSDNYEYRAGRNSRLQEILSLLRNSPEEI